VRKILIVFGTRPEAIKLCPLIWHLRTQPRIKTVVCVTGQHSDMLAQVLEVFRVEPDYNLALMTPAQTLYQSAARILSALEDVLQAEKPDVIVVQGDTTTTFCGALAAFYQKIPLAHVEAGLRTGDIRQPFPEEMNRVLTGRLATLHFAATKWAADNLYREGVCADSVWVTGNTGIDAVLHTVARLEAGEIQASVEPALDADKKLIVVTAHRRENFGIGLDGICAALRQLADRGDVQIVFPVHPNPAIQQGARKWLAGSGNIMLIEPLDYVSFINLMRRAYMIITDSGGIQEEAPSLGKPVLVLRKKTERPEAVAAGTVVLVGTDPAKIVAEASLLLDTPTVYLSRARLHNPYGDGQARQRIGSELAQFVGEDARAAVA